MSPFKSTRIAWSVAIAALALWAFSAPISWGQAAASATRLFDQGDMNVDTSADDGTTQAQPTACVALPPALVQVVPTLIAPTVPATPAVPAAPAVTGTDSGTFPVCGPDAQTAHDIEQLIAGRSFSATLSARGDGCAELTIRVTGPVASGTSTSNVSVSLGSGRNLSIKITSQAGATSVSIG